MLYFGDSKALPYLKFILIFTYSGREWGKENRHGVFRLSIRDFARVRRKAAKHLLSLLAVAYQPVVILSRSTSLHAFHFHLLLGNSEVDGHEEIPLSATHEFGVSQEGFLAAWWRAAHAGSCLEMWLSKYCHAV